MARSIKFKLLTAKIKSFLSRYWKAILPVFLTFSLALSVLAVRQTTQLASKAAQAKLKLYILPSSQTLPPRNTFRIMLDAKNKKIGFVKIVLQFNKDKVNLDGEIQVSDKLKTVVKKTSKNDANSTGKATLVLGLATDDLGNPPSGVFEIARFPVKVVTNRKNQSTRLRISPNSQIVGVGSSVLVFKTEPAQLTLNPPQTPTPTPTKTPSPTPTPTPTKTPAPTPTRTPTPTPTRTPTPTPQAKHGDANGDNKVNEADYLIWRNNLGKQTARGAAAGDFNKDGTVNGRDYIIWVKNYGT